MNFERNRNITFESRVDAPFWQGLGEGSVKIQRCRQCRTWIWPAEHRCGACGCFDIGWQACDAGGVIYSWTRTHYPFVAGYRDVVPYINVLVALPQAGNRRLIGLLLDDVDRVAIGDHVVPVVQTPQPRTQNLPALCWRLAQRDR